MKQLQEYAKITCTNLAFAPSRPHISTIEVIGLLDDAIAVIGEVKSSVTIRLPFCSTKFNVKHASRGADDVSNSFVDELLLISML